MEIGQNIDKATHWLIDSCIQDNNPQSLAFGSFRAWFDPKLKEYAYPYPEITGYALSTLSFLSQYDKENSRILQSANRAADYLVRQCLSNKTGKFYAHNISNGNSEFVFTFDVGMILKGLFHSYKSSNVGNNRTTCLRLGEWLLRMQKPDGSFYAYYDIEQKLKKSSMKRWSTQSGSFHMKLSFSLTQLYQETADQKYLSSLKKLVDWVMGMQQPDGRFVTDQSQGSTFLHAHCYSIEGLLDSYNVLLDEGIRDAAYKGISWLIKMYQKKRTLPSVYYSDGRYFSEERSDIIAQTIRLLCIAKHDVDGCEEVIQELLKRLLSFQCFSKDQSLDGGFRFHTIINDENKDDKTYHLNTWASMAAVHAMIMYQSTSDCSNMQYFI